MKGEKKRKEKKQSKPKARREKEGKIVQTRLETF